MKGQIDWFAPLSDEAMKCLAKRISDADCHLANLGIALHETHHAGEFKNCKDPTCFYVGAYFSIYFSEINFTDILAAGRQNKVRAALVDVLAVGTGVRPYSDQVLEAAAEEYEKQRESAKAKSVPHALREFDDAIKKIKENQRTSVDAGGEKTDGREAIPPRLRFIVLRRDGFKCVYCGKTSEESKLHVDHVKPVSHGGETIVDNLVAACVECNIGKSNKIEVTA